MNIKIDVDSGVRDVWVTLSRRNLETLLSKLDRGKQASACLLTRHCEDGTYLMVHAEEDGEHYAKRAPGEVHPLDDPERAT